MPQFTDEERLNRLEAWLIANQGQTLIIGRFRGSKGLEFVAISDEEDEVLSVYSTLRGALDELLAEEAEHNASQGRLL